MRHCLVQQALTICLIVAAAAPAAAQSNPTVDDPRRRAEYWRQGQKGDDQRIGPASLYQAVLSLKDIRSSKTSCAGNVAGVPVGKNVVSQMLTKANAGVDRGGWVPLGPPNVGGRTRAVVIDPTGQMWAASVGGGIWRSANAGETWAADDRGLTHLVVSALAMDPQDPSVIYAGTGESFDYRTGAGLFWRKGTGDWLPIASTTGNTDFEYVNKIAVSKDGRVLLVATAKGLFRSSDPDRSVWKKVADGAFGTVVFHPRDSQRALAGGQDNGNVLFSRNGGLRWDHARTSAPWGGRVELTYAAQNPEIVYASIDVAGGQVWRSQDGGQSFHPRATIDVTPRPSASDKRRNRPSRYLDTQGDYDNVIWAGDPTNSNLVVVGGINLWRSTDGGNRFVQISDGYKWPRSAHHDHHVIVADPAYDGKTNRSVFFGNDGGVFLAKDVLTVGLVDGWLSRNDGFAVTQFYAAATGPNGRITAGAQDNGTWLRLKDAEWKKIYGGDGGWSAIHPTNENLMYASSQRLNIYRIKVRGNAQGDFETDLNNIVGRRTCPEKEQDCYPWKLGRFVLPDVQDGDVQFIAPFVMDPNEPKHILAGGRSLWRTKNADADENQDSGPTWDWIKRPSGSLINAIAIQPADSNRVWVCYSRDGEVAVSTNATRERPDWNSLYVPDFFGSVRRCNAIAVDPNNPNRAYLGFGGSYANGALWRYEKQGEQWTEAGWKDLSKGSGWVKEAPVWAVTVHPRQSQWIYAGTALGLMVSADGGENWCAGSQGPVNTAVMHLTWAKEPDGAAKLIASTYGRGVFEIRMIAP